MHEERNVHTFVPGNERSLCSRFVPRNESAWEPYSERLALLHTSTLVKRRVRGDLIQAYRIMKGIDKVEMEHFFELNDGGGYDLRGHSLKVKVQRSRLQPCFSQRVVCAWNS